MDNLKAVFVWVVGGFLIALMFPFAILSFLSTYVVTVVDARLNDFLTWIESTESKGE